MDHGRLHAPILTRNILAVFFPQYPHWDVSGYDTIIANSGYTAKWVKAYWGKDADVVYPPLALQNFRDSAGSPDKKKRIVSVGRFFKVPGGNNKNHLQLIDSFKSLMLPDWELLMIGAVQDQVYFNEVREAIGDDRRINIASDLTLAEYAQAIAEATFVWAATGYQPNEDIAINGALRPSSMEHFGIFPVQAASVFTVPIVHNSGGTPEGPVLTWDTPEELVQVTLDLIHNPDDLAYAKEECYTDAWKFTVEKQAERLLDIIERPVLVPPDELKAKLFVTAPDRSDLTVGMITDDLELTTGFANVGRSIARGLEERGYKIKVLGYQSAHYGPPHYEDEFYTWRGWPLEQPQSLIGRFLREEEIDVAYLNYDPGNIRNMLEMMMQENATIPVVAYMPIESAPVIDQMVDTIRLVALFNGKMVLYTRWGQQKVIEAGGPRCDFVYHGADHADFRPPVPGQAEGLREAMGWQDKFVVVYFGRNKRSKNIMTLLDVAKHLKEAGHDDYVFYIHTNVYENIPHSSVPLDEAARRRGISDIVYFAPDLQNQQWGVPYSDPRKVFVPEGATYRQIQEYTLSAMTFIERLWLASGVGGLYANVSQAEGFGLIPLEAMACGVRVVSLDDKGVQREVLGDAPVYVKSDREEYWNTGGLLYNFEPGHMAEAIVAVRNGTIEGATPEELISGGIEQAAKYKWEDAVDVIDQAILGRVSL
jgi:glycosyltransferase involved in cell wall biosynthesis